MYLEMLSMEELEKEAEQVNNPMAIALMRKYRLRLADIHEEIEESNGIILHMEIENEELQGEINRLEARIEELEEQIEQFKNRAD